MPDLNFSYQPPGGPRVKGTLLLDQDELAAFVAGDGLPDGYADDIEWEE